MTTGHSFKLIWNFQACINSVLMKGVLMRHSAVSIVELDGYYSPKIWNGNEIGHGLRVAVWASVWVECTVTTSMLECFKRGVGSCIAVGAAGCSMLWGRVDGVTVCVLGQWFIQLSLCSTPPPALPLAQSVVQMWSSFFLPGYWFSPSTQPASPLSLQPDQWSDGCRRGTCSGCTLVKCSMQSL